MYFVIIFVIIFLIFVSFVIYLLLQKHKNIELNNSDVWIYKNAKHLKNGDKCKIYNIKIYANYETRNIDVLDNIIPNELQTCIREDDVYVKKMIRVCNKNTCYTVTGSVNRGEHEIIYTNITCNNLPRCKSYLCLLSLGPVNLRQRLAKFINYDGFLSPLTIQNRHHFLFRLEISTSKLLKFGTNSGYLSFQKNTVRVIKYQNLENKESEGFKWTIIPYSEDSTSITVPQLGIIVDNNLITATVSPKNTIIFGSKQKIDINSSINNHPSNFRIIYFEIYKNQIYKPSCRNKIFNGCLNLEF